MAPDAAKRDEANKQVAMDVRSSDDDDDSFISSSPEDDPEKSLKHPLLAKQKARSSSSDSQDHRSIGFDVGAEDDADVQDEIITLGRKMLGETLASFMVIFTMLAVKINLEGNGAVTTVAMSLIGGLVVMVAIFSFGHVSGSHINPAVTIAYTAIRQFPLQLAPCYIFAHLAGALFASWMAEVTFNPSVSSIILVTPVSTVPRSLLAETIGGFLLLLVASSVSTDTRAIGQFAGLAVGSIIAIEIIIVGPVSGGALNPARALGPAIVCWEFDNVWIYVVGPTAGGLLGTLVYKLLRPESMRKLGVHQPIHLQSIHRSFRVFATTKGSFSNLFMQRR